MKTELIWSQRLGTEPIYKLATADSERIFAACGTTVQILNKSGEILKTIQTQHSKQITHLAVNVDGQKIVTVGLDNQVIFIDPSGTALFKYTHTTEIQTCAFSPNNEYFLTCADQDVGIYAQGAQKVQKYKVDGLCRACCWSENSNWFAVSNQAGQIALMDVNGVEFNKIEIGAPVWSMEVRKAVDLKNQTQAQEDSEDDIEMNEVGVFNENQTSKPQQKAAGEGDFISKNKISEDRLIVLSWDQRYRVLNPSISGSVIKNKKPQKQNSVIVAESKLPFIPLTMQIISNYVIVAGVGGKIVFLNAETGAHLIDMIQINENDPFVIGAPRGVEKLAEGKLDSKIGKNQSLSWFGFNSVWIYSILKVEPNFIYVALNTGVVCCIRFQFSAIDTLYKNFYAVREGLTSVIVKNLTTTSEAVLDVGAYVQKLAIYQSKLAVLSAGKLDIYDLQDQNLDRKNIESVLRNENSQNKKNLFLQFIKSHKINFQLKFLVLASNHFIIGGNEFVTAFDFNGVVTTSWKFKNCQINQLKTIGGIQGQENIILSTKDGRVLLLKIGNRFPVEAISHNFSITHCDISANKDLIAILDSQKTLSVFNYFSTSTNSSSKPLYQITNVSSISFDLVLPNVLAFSSENKINICLNGTIIYTHTAQKPVEILLQNGSINFNFCVSTESVGFSISQINNTEIPLTPNISHHLKRCYVALAQNLTEFDFAGELNLGLNAANLGAPVNYWSEIAVCGLFCGEFELAKEALSSIGNVRVLKNLSEIKAGNQILGVALALSLCGHFQDAAMLFAAAGELGKATELLYFVRQDGFFEVGPNSTLISQIVQNMINNALNSKELDFQLPNVSNYYKLGTSDEDIIRYKQQILAAQKQQENNKYMDFLSVYENDAEQVQNDQTYCYSTDFRILLRRKLQNLCKTEEQKQDLLIKHANFLQQISDWQAASSSYLDANQPEKAVQVLISNNQTDTLLKLVRILPPLNNNKSEAIPTDDFNFEQAQPQEDLQPLKNAFTAVLHYFEKQQNFESALFIAQRLNDAPSLLRILAAQNLWDQVEKLAEIYPEMANAVHETRANQFLREGRFMEALKRLQLAGNQEKEIAMILALIDAAVLECKFGMAKMLICQLQFLVVKMTEVGVFSAIKSLRGRILVYSGFQILQNFIKHQGSPDPRNFDLMRFTQCENSDILTVCTFLTCYSAMPPECANYDSTFLQNFESIEVQDLTKKTQEVKIEVINSNTRPQLGQLSALDLNSSSSKSLPNGISEPVIWMCLVNATMDGKTCKNGYKRLIQARLPQNLNNFVRHKYLANSAQKQQETGLELCPRCRNQIIPLPQNSVLTQRDLDILAVLPMCAPAISDVCGSCGIPIIRSAISLKILPLILVEPSEETSILELVENASSVRISNEKGEIIQIQSGNLNQILKEAPVANDGRGVQIGRDAFLELNPGKTFIIDDLYTDASALPEISVDGVVKRVFVLNNDDQEVQYCKNCCFFFESEEFELAVVMGGQCPICGDKEVDL